MPTVLHNVLLSFRSARLDVDLAAGRPAETSPQHAARARRLVTRRTRYALAASWEHLLATAHGPTGGIPSRAPIRRDRLHRAEPEIRKLIAALRATGPIPVRGVAIASCLLTDGTGPIYNAGAPDDLTAAAALAVEHLDPSLPLDQELIESALGLIEAPGRERHEHQHVPDQPGPGRRARVQARLNRFHGNA